MDVCSRPAAALGHCAAEGIAALTRTLIQSLVTRAEPRMRESEAAEA